MPEIVLSLSPEVHAQWLRFLQSRQGGQLREAGLLGDWTALGLMSNVDKYMEEGGPRPPETEDEERNRKHTDARRKLSKPQKRILPMFNENDVVTSLEVSRVLGMAPEDGARQVAEWLGNGFLVEAGERDGQATYTLNRGWQEINLSANRPSLNVPRNFHLPENLKPK